jgi:hypothetical protein
LTAEPETWVERLRRLPTPPPTAAEGGYRCGYLAGLATALTALGEFLAAEANDWWQRAEKPTAAV